jgi:3-methylcrotonyl-CoA carboxylase alpha subunit
MSRVQFLEIRPPQLKIEIDGKTYSGSFFTTKNFIDLHLPFGSFRLENPHHKTRRISSAHPEGGLTAPMPGKVTKVLVQEGNTVKKGDLLMILEAMKMEHTILSPKDGVIKMLRFKENDRVSQGEDLVELE